MNSLQKLAGCAPQSPGLLGFPPRALKRKMIGMDEDRHFDTLFSIRQTTHFRQFTLLLAISELSRLTRRGKGRRNRRKTNFLNACFNRQMKSSTFPSKPPQFWVYPPTHPFPPLDREPAPGGFLVVFQDMLRAEVRPQPPRPWGEGRGCSRLHGLPPSAGG